MTQPLGNGLGGRSRVEASTPVPAEHASAIFERTYFDHAPLMRHMAIRRFGIPAAEAEALVHDIFATYIANPGVVRGELRAYLMGAVWNAARQYRRKHDREQPLEVAPEPVGHDVAERIATQLTVARVLSQLRPDCREALRRFHGEDERGVDLAASMSRSRDALYQLLSTCREQARLLFRKLAKGRD
jgi:DNA-directed RNA polymerase specialized sigma24 family protein